jgi:hypothetical protein
VRKVTGKHEKFWPGYRIDVDKSASHHLSQNEIAMIMPVPDSYS